MPPQTPVIRTLTIVIPAFNERGHIAEVVRRAQAADIHGLEREIVAVDDGSTDGTAAALAAQAGVRLLRHERNRGKGAALKTGIAAARGEIVLIQDADLEYDASDYAAVLAPLLEGRAEAVLGSRFAHERPRFFFGRRRSPFFTHYVGNRAIIAVTNLLYGARISDYEGATKAFLKSVLDAFPVSADGFEFDNELVCKLLRRGRPIAEVPIRYQPRTYEQGKKISWRDSLRMLWCILKWRFKAF